MKQYLFAIALIATIGSVHGQTPWSLERCVQHALQNNLNVQQSELNARNAGLTTQQNQMSRLPSLNGSVSAGYQFGRTIDPTTNTFDNSRIGFNSYGLNAGVVLFDGNRINTQVQQSKIDQAAAQLDVQDTRQTIALGVATAFLNILLSEEQVANVRTQVALSQQQLTRTQRLIDAGQLAANARLELEAQLARNEQSLIEVQNALDGALLNLKQLLQLDPAQPLELDYPRAEVDESVLVQNFTLDQVYLAAQQTQANVAAARLRVESNQLSEQIARAGALPTLTLFGNLNTNYSTAFLDFTRPNTDNLRIVPAAPVRVEIDGNPIDVVFFNTEGVTFPRKGYTDQLGNNFGQSAGLSLSIPIYNNHRNSIAKERARLAVIGAEITARQVTDRLKVDVQNAITNFNAARNSYFAAQKSFTAAEAAWQDTNRRFEQGSGSAFDFNNATNNRDLARRDLTRAKYQLLFNLKVVEFYLGK